MILSSLTRSFIDLSQETYFFVSLLRFSQLFLFVSQELHVSLGYEEYGLLWYDLYEEMFVPA